MVNSRIILTAFLAVGTVVLAVPIIPEGTAGAGTPEGMLPPPPLPLEGAGVRVGITIPGGLQPGTGGIQVEHSERSLLIGAVDARGLSFAEDRFGPQQTRSSKRRRTEQAQAPVGMMAKIAFFKAYHPLHENYKRVVEQTEQILEKSAPTVTAEEHNIARVGVRTIGVLYHIVEVYVQGNGNGISKEKLEKIRAAFQLGEPWENIPAAREVGSYPRLPTNYRTIADRLSRKLEEAKD
ncbi:hypothetical protein EV368DRAFT_68536 [Lentinula lateritia]|nr:hypothetical protein EV368DRAFT_68536 [Lentinula lateritia]